MSDFLSHANSLWLFVALALALIAVLVLVFLSGMVRGQSKSENAPPPPPPDPKDDPKAARAQSKELAATRGQGWQSAAASFARTMSFLKNTVAGRDYRYAIPWFLVIGEPGSGKSTLLAQTGVNLAPEEGSGEGSSNSPLEWRFLDKGILLGVAGNYIAAGPGQARDEQGWTRLLKLLQNNRPRRPLDGVVLTIPASDLIGQAAMEEAQLGNRAARMADLLAQAQRTLGFSFPVYVVVTKCDEVSGFASFCRELPPRAEHEIFGWSSPYNVEATFSTDWVTEAFDHLSNQMRMLQSEIFVDKNDLAHPEEVFLFPEELARMRTPVRIFLDRLLRETSYRESFRFRGIYFTGDITEKPVTELPHSPAFMPSSMALVPVGGQSPELPSSLPPSMEDGQIPASWLSEIAPARARAANRYSVKSPVFLKDLFERKIFPEAGIAQPLSKLFLARTRSVLIVQIVAALLAVLLIAGSIYSYTQLNAERGKLLTMLQFMLKLDSSGKAASVGKGDSANEGERYNLLVQMKPAGNTPFYSWFLPTSHLSSVDDNITKVMEYACRRWVLTSMRDGLEQKAESILYSPVGPAPPKARSAETEVESVPNSGTDISALPEYRRLSGFVDDIDELQANIVIYEELRQQGNIAEFEKIRNLLKYLNSTANFQDVSSDGHFATAIRNATGPEFIYQDKHKAQAKRQLKTMICLTFDSWFNSSILLGYTQQLSDQINRLEQGSSRSTRAGRGTSYADLLDLLQFMKETESTFGSPGFQWVSNPTLDLRTGPFQHVIYEPIRTLNNPYLTGDILEYAQSRGNEHLKLLTDQLKEEHTGITGPVLKVTVNNPIVLSDGAAKLKLALENTVNLRFMTQPGSRAINTNFQKDTRVIWQMDQLQDAIRLFDIYDRYLGEVLVDRRSALYDSLSHIALDQLRRVVQDDIGASEQIQPRVGVNAQLIAEDQTQREVDAFKDASQVLVDLAVRARQLNFIDVNKATMRAMAQQSINMLEVLNTRLEEESPYANKNGNFEFSWWDGKKITSLTAYGLEDASSLQDQLNAEHEKIRLLAKHSEPFIAFLNGQVISRGDTQRIGYEVPSHGEAESKLISKFQKLISDFQQYDSKKAPNTVATAAAGTNIGKLETFILTDMDKITPQTNCQDLSATGDTGDQNLDYFLQIRAVLRRNLIAKCKTLSTQEVFKSYSEISVSFRENLRAKFPFGPNPVDRTAAEVSADDLKRFYDIFDQNYSQAKDTLTEDQNEGGTRFGGAGGQALAFLEKMRAIEPFVNPTDGTEDFGFDLTPHFRVNQNGGESGANEIIEWTMQIGGQIFHQGEPDHSAHWKAGFPIRLSLRWATDSIYEPYKAPNDRTQPNLRVRARTAFFEYLNKWSLLSFLMRQPNVPLDLLGQGNDTKPYTLKFNILTMRDPKWTKADLQQAGTPAITFMHLNVAKSGTKNPITLPAFPFPQEAPSLGPSPSSTGRR